MKEYPIVAVLWEDHTNFSRRELPKNSDLSDYIRPSLTLGLLYKTTKKFIVVVNHVDRYEDTDESDFMIIFKDAILSVQQYGAIKIKKLKGA
jgi:hypothetical protein